MKIRTKKDVKKLEEKIKVELGIEVSKYKNEEVVTNFVELILIPTYIVSWVIRPILVALFLYLFGFYFLDLVHIEYVLYAIIGFVLFLVFGIAFGFLSLMFKMKKDIWEIVDYSLDILKLSVEDVSKINNTITEENKKDVLSLLFKGIIHVVTIPLFSEVITSKMPFIGSLASSVVKRVLTLVSDKLEFQGENIEDYVDKPIEDNKKILTSYIKTIIATSRSLESFIDFTFKIAKFPFIIFFCISLSFLGLFLYLIN
ncbi:hypothetical protein [uncultured Tenacibaculum sp.]|uniref:hypothetical protein n=1 Tax=uncultured Tenacibaculum sp. TaxID=174713 RepID=UPI002604C2FF|nr:hypothetical protein [uncultured Tenacibaculum sp.]